MAKDIHDRICVRPGCRVRAVHQTSDRTFFCDEHLPFAWNEDRVATIRKMYAEGFTATEMARKVGAKSRAAVIGKLHRIGAISPDRAEARRIAAAINTPKKKKPKPPLTAPVAALISDDKPDQMAPKSFKIAGPTVASLNLQITDDRFGGCRWPTMGEGAATLFCCVLTGGAIYCPAHGSRAFSAVPAKGPKSANELARSLRRYA
jgi:GcrA cell cycle regulator